MFVCLFSVCPSLSVAFFICQGFSNSTHSDFSVVAFINTNTLWSIIMITCLRKPLLSLFSEIENSKAEEPKTFPLDDCNYWNA